MGEDDENSIHMKTTILGDVSSSSDSQQSPGPVATRPGDIQMDKEIEMQSDSDGSENIMSDESLGYQSLSATGKTGCSDIPMNKPSDDLYCAVVIDNSPLDGLFLAFIDNDCLGLERGGGIRIFLHVSSEDILHINRSTSTLTIFSRRYVARLTCDTPLHVDILKKRLMFICHQRRNLIAQTHLANQVCYPAANGFGPNMNANMNSIFQAIFQAGHRNGITRVEDVGKLMTASLQFQFPVNNFRTHNSFDDPHPGPSRDCRPLQVSPATSNHLRSVEQNKINARRIKISKLRHEHYRKCVQDAIWNQREHARRMHLVSRCSHKQKEAPESVAIPASPNPQLEPLCDDRNNSLSSLHWHK